MFESNSAEAVLVTSVMEGLLVLLESQPGMVYTS
jgi:hypothetical protein